MKEFKVIPNGCGAIIYVDAYEDLPEQLITTIKWYSIYAWQTSEGFFYEYNCLQDFVNAQNKMIQAGYEPSNACKFTAPSRG